MNRLRTKFEREQGFTLIEIIVTILIVSILTAVAVMFFLNQRKATIDSSVQSDIQNAIVKVEKWKAMNPNGTPSDTLLTGPYSDPNTTITITVNSNGSYNLFGYNPNGDKSSKGSGIIHDSRRTGF